MAVSADQQRVKTLLTETIILLCKNGLHFKDEFTVEGLIGITIDKNDVFLINIKETIGLNQPNLNSVNIHLDNTPHMKRPLMKKRRFHSTYIMQNVRHRNDSETASDVENPLKMADDLNISASSSLSLSYINHHNTNSRIDDSNYQSHIRHQLHLQHQQQCLKNNNNNNNNNNNSTQDINENPVDFSISLNSSKDTSFDSCKYQDTLNNNNNNNYNDVSNSIESKNNTGMHTPELNKIDLDNSYQNSQQQQHHSQYHLHYDSTMHNNNSNNADNNSAQSQFQIYTDKNDNQGYNDNTNTNDSNINVSNSIINNSNSNLDHSMAQNDVINHHNINNHSNDDDIINDNININHFNDNICSKSIQNNSASHISDCEMAPTIVIKEELNDIELNSQHYNNNINNNNINNMCNNNSNSLHNNVTNSCQSGSISVQKPHKRPRHPKSRRYSLIDGASLDPHNYQLFHDQAEQQVELLAGSGVFITMRAYAYLTKETWSRGSKLVRRVVREVFPDEHILARSSCLGKRLGGCHVGLDHHKVDTIKAFVQQRMPQVSHTEIVAAINECCRDIRAKLRKSFHRNTTSTSSLKNA